MSKKIPFLNPINLLVTFFGAGKFPVAPGSFASFLSFFLYFLFIFLTIKLKGGVAQIASNEVTNYLLFFTTILFLLGIWGSSEYSRIVDSKDPEEVVIDEIVGQLLSTTLIVALIPFAKYEVSQIFDNYSISIDKLFYICLVGSFICFRIFDIYKPWPISWVDEKIDGGFGIMLDDIVAAIFSVMLFYGIVFFSIDIIQ